MIMQSHPSHVSLGENLKTQEELNAEQLKKDKDLLHLREYHDKIQWVLQSFNSQEKSVKITNVRFNEDFKQLVRIYNAAVDEPI